MKDQGLVELLLLGLCIFCAGAFCLIVIHCVRSRRGNRPFKMLFRFYSAHQVLAARYSGGRYKHRARHNTLHRMFYIGLLLLIALLVAAYNSGLYGH